MSPRRLSVVTATYNCGAKIASTVRSVLAQDASLFDCLVVDGGSTDETLGVLETFGDAITVVSERDRGVFDALNKGIARSTGTYLYFLGAGDTVRAGAFSRLAPCPTRTTRSSTATPSASVRAASTTADSPRAISPSAICVIRLRSTRVRCSSGSGRTTCGIRSQPTGCST
jgi:glycosyltransferase involved in cell wall biosynthesis